jgi:hypothetical protein
MEACLEKPLMPRLLVAAILVLIPITELVVMVRMKFLGNSGPAIFVATLIPLLIWAAKQETKFRRLSLQKGTASFGFEPADNDDVALSVYPMRVPGRVACAAGGKLRGLQGWIFDYVIRTDPGETRSLIQTVMGFRVDDANLPIFQIRPRGMGTLIDDWEKDDPVFFPDALRFHQQFELLSSAEEGVRRHFDAKLLDTVAALNDCNFIVQGFDNTVLVFTYAKTLAPKEMEAFANKGADIASTIFATEKRVMTAGAN